LRSRWLPVCLGLSGLILPLSALADGTEYTWLAELNVPGLSLGFRPLPHLDLCARFQYWEGVSVAGLRSQYYLAHPGPFWIVGGAEVDYVGFQADEVAGAGLAAEVFLGAEYMFLEPFSLQADLGPAWISLQDRDSQIPLAGTEWVVNLGLRYYFGRRGP